jgi:acetyl-CoA decarbonylase/synthase complex subunit gamma
MAVYKLLPQTNCRDCGEATCMGFAFGLIQGNHTLEECPGLVDEHLAALKLLL